MTHCHIQVKMLVCSYVFMVVFLMAESVIKLHFAGYMQCVVVRVLC